MRKPVHPSRLIFASVSLLPLKKVYALTCVMVPFYTAWQKHRCESSKLQICKYGIICRCDYRQSEIMQPGKMFWCKTAEVFRSATLKVAICRLVNLSLMLSCHLEGASE